jgi:hypothetical protein
MKNGFFFFTVWILICCSGFYFAAFVLHKWREHTFLSIPSAAIAEKGHAYLEGSSNDSGDRSITSSLVVLDMKKLSAPATDGDRYLTIFDQAEAAINEVPKRVAAAAAKIRDPVLRFRFLDAYVGLRVQKDPLGMMEWLNSSEDLENRESLLQTAAIAWISLDADAASKYLFSQPDISNTLAVAVINSWALKDLESAASFSQTLPVAIRQEAFKLSFAFGSDGTINEALHFANAFQLPLGNSIVKTIAQSSQNESEFQDWCRTLTPFQQAVAIESYVGDPTSPFDVSKLSEWLEMTSSAAAELKILQNWALKRANDDPTIIANELRMIQNPSSREAALRTLSVFSKNMDAIRSVLNTADP